ncbi:MAG: aldolase [Beijerinckiaceae bacterium]|nr:aldolase [Beijerinckiaceae bacterium]
MSAPEPASIHAAAVVVGEAGVLIRGVSGAGKSSLALAVVEAAGLRSLFARLVADDRVLIEHAAGRLIARPHPAIAGRVERRGQGVEDVGHEAAAVLRCIVDLAPALETPGAPDRMPSEGGDTADLAGVKLPRLVVPTGLGAVESARITLDFLLRSRI